MPAYSAPYFLFLFSLLFLFLFKSASAISLSTLKDSAFLSANKYFVAICPFVLMYFHNEKRHSHCLGNNKNTNNLGNLFK